MITWKKTLSGIIGTLAVVALVGAVNPAEGKNTNENHSPEKLSGPVEATVTGSNFCVGCTLKKKHDAKAQCSAYGHKHSLRLSGARIDGESVPEMKGWVLHYLPTDKSQDLIDKHHGEDLTVTGTVYPEERVIEVSSYENTADRKKETGELNWHTSMERALAEAEERDAPVLVDFYADWCGWCKKMEKETFSDAEVRARMRDFVLLKIDTDEQAELAKRYGVRGLPTTLILNSEGKTLEKQPGYMPAEDYLKLLHGDF